METEAEVPEPITSNKIGAKDEESICSEPESCTGLQKVEIEHGLPAKIVENLTKTEDLEVDTNVNNEIVSCVIKGDVGTCEGESFLVSPSLAKVPTENTYRASESTVVDEKMILQQQTLDNETQLQKDLIQEAIEEKHDITVAENLNAFVKQVSADTGLENDGEPPPSIDEGKETLKKKKTIGQEVEILNTQAPNKELPYNVEEVKALNHSQEDAIEGKKSSEEPELELIEHVHETSKATTDQNQEALPFTPGPIGENLKTDATDIIDTCIKDASTDDASTKQDVEESGIEGETLKGQEKSSIPGAMEPGPTIVNASENTGEKKQGEESSEHNNIDSVPKAEEDSNILNDEENINNSEGANEMFHIRPTKFMTEDKSSDKFEQKSGSVEQSSKETVDSNETSDGEYPGENENRNTDADIPLDTEETRSAKSEQEAGKHEEITSSDFEEKSQETTDSNEKTKDEKPLEFELQDTEDLESPLVTLATEGSHFQEDEPHKIEETSEHESVNIGKDKFVEAIPQDTILETAESTISQKTKDDENPETKLDASSVKDEEGLPTESEKLVFPMTNPSIKDNDDKKESPVIETRDNIEVTKIIETEENCGWETQKDVEASVQNLQTDEPEEEKLEKSLDVVSEAVKPAASNVEAQRSTSEKEEEANKTIGGNFNEESKEGNINWDHEAKGQRKQKDENHTADDQNQKIETMEVESPNMEMGTLLVPHSLAEGSIQEACEQQQEVSNLELEEQVTEENINSPVEDKHMEEEFRAGKNMESTILEQEKTRDSAQTVELISQVRGMEVEETVKVCELDSEAKSPETDASQKIEEQTEKNEETSERVLDEKATEREVEKMIIEEDSCIPDQGFVFFGNQTDGQNSEVEENEEAPEYNSEEQNSQANDAVKATKNEVINKEASAEPKIAGVGKDPEQQIIEESTDMAHSTESVEEPFKEDSQEGDIMKKHEGEAHKGTDRECEVLEKSSNVENMERQKVAENSALENLLAPSIPEETIIESCQEDEVSEGLEETAAGGETERAIYKEYGAVTEPRMLSVAGATVTEISEEDGKEAEKFKEDKFTNKQADASGITEVTREEALKEQSQKFVVYEEQSKKDLEDALNNNERLETASARTSQEAEQERQQLLEGSNHANEEKSPVKTETSWTSLQHVEMKGEKLGETPNSSQYDTQQKKEILDQEVETMDERATKLHNVEGVRALNHSQEDETEGKKFSEEPELEPGDQVHETNRATTDQNQEALTFTPDLIGDNLKIDVMDIVQDCINDASTDNAPTKQDVEESGTEAVTLKEQEKSSITGDMETGPTIVNPSEITGEKKSEGEEYPEDNNTDSVSKAEENSKIQNDEHIINNSEGTNETFHVPQTASMTEDTRMDKLQQESRNFEQSRKETILSNEMVNGENPDENESPDDNVEILVVTEETRSDKSENEARKLEETPSSELEEKSQETIDSNEKMKDEHPSEYELPDNEDVKSPLVTLETEGSHFQEQDEPDKIEEGSEIEAENIGKDKISGAEPQDIVLERAESTISAKATIDENPEKNLDAFTNKDEESPQRESEQLPLKNASIKENNDKKGSSVVETIDDTEVTEIIEAEENSRWEIPKDVEASEHSLRTDETEEEKLEKSLDVLSEAVETDFSNAEAERSTSEKEEESNKKVEEIFNNEIGHKKQRNENPTAVDQSQKVENMEVESPNREMGNLLVPHSLAGGSIQEVCEQQQEVSDLEVEEQVNEENINAPAEDYHMEEEFRAGKKMESTILEQGKTRDGAQTLELISQVRGIEVEETVKVCELDSKEKSPETDASQKIEEQTEKNEETSERVLGEKVTEGEVEEVIREEDSCILDQRTVYLGNQTDRNSEDAEKKEAPEFNGEEQDRKANDNDKATRNEIINKEESAQPEKAGVGEDTEKDIIEESTDMTHSTESTKEPLKESSQEGEFMKKHEDEVHVGLDTECEVIEKFSTGENAERQKVVENSTVKDYSTSSIDQEIVTASCQKDEVSERLEAAGIGRETERAILEEHSASTDTCRLSVVGATVKERSEEDRKEAEKLKEEDKFTDFEVATLKNTEVTNKIADASGHAEASREEILHKEDRQKFAVYQEQINENDLKEAENNYKRYEAASTRMSQEAEQEGGQLVEGSNLASEEKSPITIETSWISSQHADVKEVKLEETPNTSDYETQQKKEILHQELETMDKQAPNNDLSHNVEQVKALYHSQEDEIENKRSIEEPELEVGEQVHETSRETTDQNQEALPFTPDSVGENLKRDVIDNIDTCIKDASTDNTPTKQDVKESSIEGVTLKGEEKSSITEAAETGPTIVNPSENAGEKKLEGEENPEDNNSDSVSKDEEGSKIQNHEENINNSEGTNETFNIPSTKYMKEDTSSNKSEQKSGNIEQSSEETVDSNDMLNGEYPRDDVEIPLVTEETRLDKSEQEAVKLEETSCSEMEEKSQETNYSNETMKDEKPVECELPDTEDLESPQVTLATEGSQFQEKDEPDKIKETSEIESVNIGKDKCNEAEPQGIILETDVSTITEKATDDENPETNLDASTIKEEERPQRESEKLILPLTYSSIKENNDKKGSNVTETGDHIEDTEMAKEISRYEIPKDVEASEQSLQTDEAEKENVEKSLDVVSEAVEPEMAEEISRYEIPKDVEASEQHLQMDEAEEENVEKSLDVVSEAVEPAVSYAGAERRISKKEEESIKRVVEDSNEERKEGNINWDDEAREQRLQKDEVSAEPNIAGVCEGIKKHIIEENTDMANSTESMKEPVKESSQEGEYVKKNDEEVHKGPDTEYEVLDKSSTGENTERQKVAEKSAVNDHPARTIQEETEIESRQEDEVPERLEATGVVAETEQANSEEYGAVTDTCILSKEEEKEAEKLKEDIKFTDFEVVTLKNIEDTNKNADASGHTVASREELLHKEDSRKSAVNEEQIKEKDIEEVENNCERFETASARTPQEAEQEGEKLVDGSNLDSEEHNPITTEKSSTIVDVNSVKLEKTPNPSHNAENMLKVEEQYAVEGNEEKGCEMKAESSYTLTGFQYEGIESTTGQEITNVEAPLANRLEETLQGSSTLTPKGQELDSIEESKETKDETSMQDKNFEIHYVAKSTGEISIQEEEPWKDEDVSKMGTDITGKESLNEKLNENGSAKEKKLPESDPEKNIADSKDANEICEDATELTLLGENSRTETLKDEGKLQESSEEGELDGEKPFDAMSIDVETNSPCANIEKDVLAQEDHIKNLNEIPEGGSIGSDKVENVGIKLEAEDQRNEGFDPTENTALQEIIEDVDPSHKPERAHETMAKHQSHETLPGAKENKIKEDDRDLLDHNTVSIEYPMPMQRLQEKEKDSMNPEDTGHKDKAEPQTGEKDKPNETTETAILNEMANNGHDKAEKSQNISKWSMEEESTAKGLHTVSIEYGRVNEVQDSSILSIEKCTKEIDDDVKTEKLNIETVEFLNKRPDSPEASPITVPEDIMGISKSVPEPEVSEELTKEDIFKQAVKSNDQLTVASIAAIHVTSQESEAGGGNLVREFNIGSQEKFQGTVVTGSMDEEVKEVKLDQNSNSRIQLPSEGKNANNEIQKMEKIHASEIEEEMKSSSDAEAESEYQAVKAITEAETTANQPPLVEESDKMPEENITLEKKNSNGLFSPEETEDVCLQREEPMELEQTSKMGFQDIKKGSLNEQEEKDEKPDEAPNLDSITLASAEKDNNSFQERERNTELIEASDFGRTEASKEEENENLVSQKEEPEGRKIEIPFNEVSGEYNADGPKVNTEKDLEKDDQVKTTEETLEEKAEIPHFISEQQETEPPSSIDKIDMGKTKDEADKDLDASPTPNSPAEEVIEEEAVNHPEVTQLVPEELIHAINETNEENREGAAEDKNVVQEPTDVQKPTNTSATLVPNPGDIMEDLHPIDQEVPTNDSDALSLIEDSQEQGPEKGSQMTENDEKHSLEFGKKPTGEVNLPRGTMEGDPANDEVAVKEISKECETMNDYRCLQETNASEQGETSILQQENMVAFSSVEQATAERSFRYNPNKHDTRTNVVIEDQNHHPPCAGEETVKNVHQVDNMEGKKVDEIATIMKVEDKSQALGATEDQEEEINAENENPNCETLNEDVSEGLEKAGASATIENQTMEENQMVKDLSAASVGEETYKESQHKVVKDGNMANDTNVKVDLKDQGRGLDDEEDLKDKANEVSNGFEDAGSSERMEKQIKDEQAMNDLHQVSFKEEMVREDNEEGKKASQEVEKEVTKLDPRDQNHEISCNDDATENNIINEEVKSSDEIFLEQQLASTPSTNEADAMTIKDEANKHLDTSPTPNSLAEEALEEEIVNEPKEITQLVPELIHGINETIEDNKGTAEDMNAVKQLNKVQNPTDTSSSLVSNLQNIMEDLNSKDKEVRISNFASCPTESLHDHIPEKEDHVMEDEERNSLMMVKQEKREVNLPGEETEGDPIKDEVQDEEIIQEEGEKMNEYNYLQETTSGNGGEIPVQEQEHIVIFSSVEQATREQSIQDSPRDHDTSSTLVIEDQSLVKGSYGECVGEETIKKIHQDQREGKKADEMATKLEAKDKCQASGNIQDQMEKITDINYHPKCIILNEEMPEELEKAVTTENIEKQKMVENRTAKEPCIVSIGGDTCKENHHEDKHEREMVNDVEIKWHIEEQSQEESAAEDLGDKANETYKTTNCQTSNDEVSLGTENAGSSEKIDEQITEDKAIKESFLAAIGEETTKKAHQEEEKDGPEIEKEATNLDPKDQNNKTSSQNDATENHILNEEVGSSHFAPVEHDLETTASSSTDEKMAIMTMKEDTDFSYAPNTTAEEATEGGAVIEPQEVPHHEPRQLIDESFIINEEDMESTTKAKIVAEEFIEVGKLKTTSSDLVSNPSNIGESLHMKEQEVPTNKFNASSLNEVLPEKTPEKEGHMTEDEERNSWVWIKHETGETSPATGEMEVYPINNEAPEEILNKEAGKMNDTDANISNCGRETPIPEHQQRAIFSSIEQAIAESSIKDSPEVPDTTGNLVYDKQSQVKSSLMHEVQIHQNEKTKGINLEDTGSLNEKLSLLSDAQPSEKELPQKADSVMLPDVTEISQNIENLQKAPDTTTEEGTQKRIPTGQKDIPPVPEHLIGKSLWGDEAEDQRHGEASETESKEEGVKNGGDSIMEDVTEEPKLLDTDKVSLSALLKSTKETLPMVAGNTEPTPLSNEGELQCKDQQIIQDEKEDIMEEETHEVQEEEENYRKEMHSGSSPPVLLEVPRNADVKPTHKKSHKMLSGVGSKVKHSIAKIKKAIACTYPPPEDTITELRK